MSTKTATTTRADTDGATATVAASAFNLSKVYGQDRTQVRALDQVSINFAKGSFTAIMGASGSGKSTLMHCLAGLDTITSGKVFLGGIELSALNDRQLTRVRRDRIGFVFQSFNLLPTLNAKDNILLPLDLAGTKVDRDHFDGLVASLGLGDRLAHRPAELSGGQQQRVAIARALVTRPDILFADEPTGALDSKTGQALLDYLRTSSHEAGQTIVMVTHDPLAAAYADRAVILADGRITHDLPDPDADAVLGIIRGQAA
ncbi:ABC transporter ATP-binding protein [Microlunatus sp. Y2014]|uniref:ABC transporter ATP-binding protein n=1 Tax=Microlunatus sp. Y2014 TaxID=3418488 RepID=UPI003DA77505